MASEIPEFKDHQYDLNEFHRRLDNSKHLILVAYDNERPVGFKIGYKREDDGSFYSWLGGVLPNHRKRQIAKLLAEHQNEWAVRNGYQRIKFKTRNNCKAMLTFALKDGFNIIGV